MTYIEQELKKQLIELNGFWNDELQLVHKQLMYFIKKDSSYLKHIRSGTMEIENNIYKNMEVNYKMGDYVKIKLKYVTETNTIKYHKIFINL